MSVKDSLALKYRPTKLSEVIGQPVVVRAFENAFKSGTLHHAYILAGNYGCGKTTVARIVAATENCTGKGKDPCGTCENCQAIFAGESNEVLELDAGSSGGVDDIREIHKNLYSSPIECKVKYVILDEAHRLSGAAAEASLKMIEEPPDFARFILCTTEPQSFKPTIHSRCVSWKFNKVNWVEMLPLLKRVAEAEGLDCEDKAMSVMAKYSKGSVRSALQNMQTVVNFVGDGSITEKDARDAMGVVNEKHYFDLISGIIDCNAVKCYQSINEMLRDGKEARLVVDGIYEHLNSLLVVKACRSDLSSFDFSDIEVKRLSHQAGRISGDLLLTIMNLMAHVAFGLEYSLNPQQLLNKFAIESIMAEKRKPKQ